MKIVIAPDSFKESLTAAQAARAIHRGARKVFKNARFTLVPMADGGEGTLQALIDGLSGRIMTERVSDPLGRKIRARWGWVARKRIAVIEMAEASGLALVPPRRRNPMKTHTFGTGELIRKALDRGARTIVLTLGGVATNDAGAGLASALGFRFFDARGRNIPDGVAGLSRLDRIDASNAHPRLRHVKFIAATDVTNPLCGPRGSARVYGPQKGATAAMIPVIDRTLRHFAKIVRRDLKRDVLNVPGAGAAGGSGAGALAFLRAAIRPGFKIVAEAAGLDRAIRGADLAITGEGRIDSQTRFGKTPFGVARCARRHRVPVIAFCGILDASSAELKAVGLEAAYPLVTGSISRAQAVQNAAKLLTMRTESVLKNFR